MKKSTKETVQFIVALLALITVFYFITNKVVNDIDDAIEQDLKEAEIKQNKEAELKEFKRKYDAGYWDNE